MSGDSAPSSEEMNAALTRLMESEFARGYATCLNYRLDLIEPTEAMIAAYLKANDQYWYANDQLRPPTGRWRNGTVREATKVALTAALKEIKP